MVEGAKRQKTPNEIALTILLVAMTLVFLLATVTLLPYSIYSVDVAKAGTPVSITVLVALLVCLIPTTIGGLLSAIGVAGMGRMMRANVIATSGRAVEAAGDCDVLLLDKTGTITFGNRQASALHAVSGVTQQQLAEATLLASLGDETPEGKSIVALAKRAFGIAPPPLEPGQFTIIPFSAQTRMSGVTYRGRELRKGALDAIQAWVTCSRAARVGRGSRRARRGSRAPRRHAAGRRGRPARAGRRRIEGHRQDAHQGALRRAAQDGHQDHHDHRRQQAHRRVDRRRSRCRRLPGRGDARGQAQADSRNPGRRQAGRDDRRRHQRRAGARAGRRRRRDEQRHASGEGSRQHGRPRLEPDQIDRDRRDRQAAPDHARLADDVLHRQRRRQVLRDHSGGVCQHLSGARCAQRHAPRDAAERHPVGRHLQRADHSGIDSAGAARRQVPRGRRGRGPAAEHARSTASAASCCRSSASRSSTCCSSSCASPDPSEIHHVRLAPPLIADAGRAVRC